MLDRPLPASWTVGRARDAYGTLKSIHDSFATDEALLTEMKEEAAERGCDGLVIMQRGGNVFIATCIAYVDG